ncbi:MAG TPA: chemotaxis protein CheB [Terriglobales bacterium]|nr:chemotaxis protein CheB [Terriglobales bacterium]
MSARASKPKVRKRATGQVRPAPTPGLSAARGLGPFDVVAIGASAGGLNALTQLLEPLDANFPCTILVVQHLDPHHKSRLGELLSRRAHLPIKEAEHGEKALPGTVYLAPPDRHLLVEQGIIQLAQSKVVHFSRPSIDLLFESVAGTYGKRCIGVVLSGSNSDGAAGIRTIKEAGGVTISQKPSTAEYRTMPQAAVSTGCVDYVLTLSEIGPLLCQLCAVTPGKHA